MTDLSYFVAMRVVCPNCKGKGYVFDPMSLLLTVGLPFAMLLESDSKRGMTKQDCPSCDGEGRIDLDEDDYE